MPFLLTDSKLSQVKKLPVRGSISFPTKCSSHSIGTSAALKTSLTEAAISGPIPSPGNKVARMVSVPAIDPSRLAPNHLTEDENVESISLRQPENCGFPLCPMMLLSRHRAVRAAIEIFQRK
eukprot:Gb_19721 [translate_table: standard]